MDRKNFLKTTAILGATSLLPTNSLLAANLEDNGIDKLVDENGNFVQSPLPFNQNFLEPSMDEETVGLHYTFHHGGAVKGANKDLQM
ncbi:MAG TPA: superoxide dismutase, partial [Bacteroidia bacterium]|nr:superoxide dismutase [Bacteroidia bacterium]